MERTPSLDDIRLFLAVADAGGLAGASRATGIAAPTLTRRMTELERGLNRRLFLRGPRGYALTAEGRALLAEAEPLRMAAARIAGFAATAPVPRVRISAGMWTSHFLATAITRVWTPGDGWMPEFLTSNAVVDIARREADIGIRARRPDQDWLAGRVTSRVEYAVYAARPEVRGFLTLAEGLPTTPAERWIRAHHGDAIVTTASDGRLLLDLALSGLGRVVMPVFAGESIAGLVRVGGPIDEIAHEEWLVAHHEARHDPPVRAALDALARLLSDRSARTWAPPRRHRDDSDPSVE